MKLKQAAAQRFQTNQNYSKCAVKNYFKNTTTTPIHLPPCQFIIHSIEFLNI